SISISVLNTYSLLDTIVADPAAFGFTNVTQACLTGEVNYSGGTPCGTPNQYLFWDQLHPTAAADVFVADAALSLVVPAVKLLINNTTVTPSFAGLSAAGLYQINFTVPSGLGVGDVPLQATVGGTQTPSGIVVSLQ